MKAWAVEKRGRVEDKPLRLLDAPEPGPGPGEILVRVEACGVCRTDLHVIEGELPVHKDPVIPGHQIVGRVEALGRGAKGFKKGDRAGIAWLNASCGRCRFCERGDENLCDAPRFTGYDVDGGYADYAVAPAAFAYKLAAKADPVSTAPLLCAGIIGYRALRRCGIQKGGRLGLYGFGASAHVVIQIARYWKCEVFVMTRGEKHRALAKMLGADWVGDAADKPPKKLDAAILFAPAGELVPPALEALDKGGTLANAGIHCSDVPALNYEKHLFYEKTLVSVAANTREDGRELLKLAAKIPVKTEVEVFPFEKANEALIRLKTDGIRGAAVLKLA